MQQEMQVKQLELLTKLSDKGNTVGGGGIGGLDTNTLIIGGGALAVVGLMMRMKR
jgi:hypothetical protein